MDCFDHGAAHTGDHLEFGSQSPGGRRGPFEVGDVISSCNGVFSVEEIGASTHPTHAGKQLALMFFINFPEKHCIFNKNLRMIFAIYILYSVYKGA